MESINDFKEKGKSFLERLRPFYNLIFILVLGSIFFAIGRLSALEEQHTPIKIEYGEIPQTGAVADSQISTNGKTQMPSSIILDTSGEVIGSKSGKKYYFPWCGTVKRIKPENQVHFESPKKARQAGFTPGGNCKGLK